MQNKNQLAHSRKIVHGANLKRFMIFGLVLATLFIGVVVGLLFSGAITGIASIKLIAGGITYAGIVGFGNIAGDVDNEYKTGKQVKSKMYFIEAAQFDDTKTFPTGTRSIGNIPLKSGQYWQTCEASLDSPEITWKGAVGDMASTITNTAKFILGGMGDDVFNFLEKGIGKGFYIVYEVCSTGEKWICGNGCKPARMTEFDGGSDKDKTGSTVTFNNECGKIWVKYTGTTPTLAAAAVAANATTIVLTSNSQYQSASGTAAAAAITAFTSTTDSDVNRLVTILGSGGAFPSTIPTGNSFIVGSTWTADAGKTITFKIYKDGASYKFVEQHRD